MTRPTDPRARLTSALRRFQRRLRLLALVRYLIVAAALALGAADLFLLQSGQDGVAVRLWIGSLAVAAIAAWLMAVVRTPTLAATARIVDSALELQDRAVSALQFSAEQDPFSRLVTADAAARLEETPVSRLPVTVPVPARWLAASMCVASALVFATSGRSLPVAPAGGGPGGLTTDAGQPSADGQPRRRTAGTPGGATESRAPASAAAPDSVPPPQARTTGSRTPEQATGRSDAASGNEPRTATTPSGSEASPQPGSRGGVQATGVTASVGRVAGYAPRGSASERSARGRGAAAPGALDNRGGGVSAGTVATGDVPSERSGSRPGGSRGTAAYAAAYARAESAMPAERVPPALRSYVRDYFMAIRPGTTQWR